MYIIIGVLFFCHFILISQKMDKKKPKNKLSLKNFEEPTVVGSVASKRLHAGRWSIPVVSHF